MSGGVEIEDTNVRAGFMVAASGAYEAHFRVFFERREEAEAYVEWCQSDPDSDRYLGLEPLIQPAAIDPKTGTIVWANHIGDAECVEALAERCGLESHE